MKTAIIGGGRGCQAIIELAKSAFLKELQLDILLVADVDPNAPGMRRAREYNIETTTDMMNALRHPGIELIIELTGSDEVLREIYGLLPEGMKLIDHTFAHIFWDLVNAQEERRNQLEEMTRLEREVEKERRFLQNLFDTLPDLVVVLGTDRRITKVNASFARFFDITPKDAIGKTCSELFEDTQFAKQCVETAPILNQVYESAQPRTVIWRTEPPNETHWEVTRTPVFGSDGRLEEVLAIWHKITERVRLRQEIETHEQRFRSFIDSAHDWISIKDLEGRYIAVNPACARAFNMEVEQFIGKTPDEILSKPLARTIQKHDDEVIQTNSHHIYDEVYQLDGRDHFFQTTRFPLTDYKGETVGVCTIARDVTSEKELRDQLVQAEKLAAVGKLAAGVAHEINNPLTGVLAYAEDLTDELDKSSPHQEDLQVIIREALRCRDIVRNLLDFARQDDPKFETADPNLVVEQALKLIEKLPQFRNVTIEREIAEDIPEIKCDPHQIQQVILNLTLNAADAMQGMGRIVVNTEFERRRHKCVISVQDSGPGIPENLIDKLFEPFFSTKGTSGLGLAVSWGIVERHGGVIEVDMPEDGGSIFRVILPVPTNGS